MPDLTGPMIEIINRAMEARKRMVDEAAAYIQRYEAGEIGQETPKERAMVVARMRREMRRVLTHPEATDSNFWLNVDRPAVSLLCHPASIFFNQKFDEDYSVDLRQDTH
jgi:hypothetical protein